MVSVGKKGVNEGVPDFDFVGHAEGDVFPLVKSVLYFIDDGGVCMYPACGGANHEPEVFAAAKDGEVGPSGVLQYVAEVGGVVDVKFLATWDEKCLRYIDGESGDAFEFLKRMDNCR